MEQLHDQLKAQYDAGQLTIEQFRTEMLRAKLRDSQGRFWIINPETGRWEVNAGGSWIEGTPPAELSAQESVPQDETEDWLEELRPPMESVPSTPLPATFAAPKRGKGLTNITMAFIIVILLFLLVLVFGALGAVLLDGLGIINLGLV